MCLAEAVDSAFDVIYVGLYTLEREVGMKDMTNLRAHAKVSLPVSHTTALPLSYSLLHSHTLTLNECRNGFHACRGSLCTGMERSPGASETRNHGNGEPAHDPFLLKVSFLFIQILSEIIRYVTKVPKKICLMCRSAN